MPFIQKPWNHCSLQQAGFSVSIQESGYMLLEMIEQFLRDVLTPEKARPISKSKRLHEKIWIALPRPGDPDKVLPVTEFPLDRIFQLFQFTLLLPTLFRIL